MSKKSISIISLIIGISLGVLSMSLLSQHASNVYFKIIRINFEFQQSNLGAKAITDKKYIQAVNHYSNLVNSSSPNSAFWSSHQENNWDLSFPFATPILSSIQKHSDPSGVGAKRGMGINHGLLAYALEQSGMEEDANIEWEKAMNLSELNDKEKIMNVVKSQIKMQNELLTN